MHPFYGPSSQLLADGSAWWLGLASMAMYLLFWAAAILIAIKLLKRYFMPGTRLFTGEDKALAILRERYAKGEIDADEFKHIKADLEEK